MIVVRRAVSRCRRCAGIWLVVASVACGGEGSTPARQVESGTPPATEAVAEGLPATDPAGSALAQRYYDGFLAEAIRGDAEAARAAYREIVIASGDGDAEVAARAALQLAELDARSGRRREGLELAARAEALAHVAGQAEIAERASRLQVRLSSRRGEAAIEVRGPAAQTELAAVSGEARARFARAEALLTAYHRIRLRPRIEALRAAIRQKQSAMDSAVKGYRAVIDLGEPVAVAAAEFRIGSLYNDLAISLMFDLPPELERSEAARLRSSLNARAIADLRRARDAYRRSLAAAGPVGERPAVASWRVAAELGARTVADLLRGR